MSIFKLSIKEKRISRENLCFSAHDLSPDILLNGYKSKSFHNNRMNILIHTVKNSKISIITV